MTVTTTNVFVDYLGDGVTTDFPTTFEFLDNGDVKVAVAGSLIGSGYSVTGAGVDGGGTVIFDVAPADLAAVHIERVMAIVQEIDPINNSTIFGNVLARGLDTTTMIVQQLQNEVQDGISIAGPAAATAIDAAYQAQVAAATAVAATVNKADKDGGNVLQAFGENAPFKQSALSEARSLADKIAKGIGPDIFDFIPDDVVPHASILDGTNVVDLTPYFQKAHDDTPEGQTIRCNNGQFRLASTINLTKAHFWDFGKPVMSPFIGTQGVIVRPTADGTSLFRLERGISPVEVRGTSFVGMTVFETAHPSAATDPWAPANYGYVIDSYYTLGETQVIDCYAPGVNKFLRSVGSGRTNLIDFKGFVFTTLKYTDVAKDRDRTISCHHWPYLYQSLSVYTWMAANTKLFIHGRVDTPYYDDIFCFGGNTLFQFNQVYYGAYAGPYIGPGAYEAASTPSNPFPAVYATGTNGGVAEPGSVNAFSTTNMVIGEAYAESFKFGIVNNAIETTLFAALFQHVGDFFGNNTPIPGGATIAANASGAKMLFGVFRPYRLDSSVIAGAAGGVEITLGATLFDDCNRSGGAGDPLINLTDVSSVVNFGSRPLLRNVYGAVLGRSVSPVQVNNVPAQTSAWIFNGAASGGTPSLVVDSTETNKGGTIATKGNGPLGFGGGGATALLTSGGLSINGTTVVKGVSEGESPAPIVALAAGASAALTVGIPGTTGDWDIIASSYIGGAAGLDIGTLYYIGSGNWNCFATNRTAAPLTIAGDLRAVAVLVGPV